MGNYWLHRISNCWDIAKPLFDKGILTIGWQALCKDNVLEAVNEWETFDSFTKRHGQESRSRWILYNFAHMEIGDTIIVTLYDKEFAITEIANGIQKISELPEDCKQVLHDNRVQLRDGFLYYETSTEPIDIGFFCQIKNTERKPRNFADARLQARMKIRQTNANINDLAELVETAKGTIEQPKPFDDIIQTLRKEMINTIRSKITPDNFELFICWLMEKLGASSSEVLAKNESGKKEGADADIVADFDLLGIRIYIQAKLHNGETDDWAVTQLEKYSHQKGQSAGGRSLYWVISTAEKFDQKAIDKSIGSNIRLINGEELADMILSVGIGDLKDFL